MVWKISVFLFFILFLGSVRSMKKWKKSRRDDFRWTSRFYCHCTNHPNFNQTIYFSVLLRFVFMFKYTPVFEYASIERKIKRMMGSIWTCLTCPNFPRWPGVTFWSASTINEDLHQSYLSHECHSESSQMPCFSWHPDPTIHRSTGAIAPNYSCSHVRPYIRYM